MQIWSSSPTPNLHSPEKVQLQTGSSLKYVISISRVQNVLSPFFTTNNLYQQ